LDFGSADQLVEIERWNHGADDRQAIGFCDFIEMVDRDHVAGAGHVLHDESGISRNMFAHMFDDQTPPEIIEIAWRRADDDGNGFTLVERSLRLGANAAQEETEKNHQTGFHIGPQQVGRCDCLRVDPVTEANRNCAQASRGKMDR
jgi:hypothetical protein